MGGAAEPGLRRLPTRDESLARRSLDGRSQEHRGRQAAGRRHRSGPGRSHRRLRAGQAGRPRHRPRGRRHGRRHQPHRRAGGLALRHRRPPVLHQGARGRGALARDPAGRGLPHAAPDEPHLLRRQAVRLPAQGQQRAARTSASSRRSAACCPTCGCACGRRRTRRSSRAGSPPASAGASTTTSSRPTPRRCGACPAASSRPTGPRSGSRTCRCSPPSATRCGRAGTPRTITSLIEEFQYPKYGPGMMWETAAKKVEAKGRARSSSRRRSGPSTGSRARASPA